MFQIGDKIFYPMHGTGTIEAVEEKEILGEKQLYYILKMSLTSMQVMVPIGKKANTVMREVADDSVVDQVLDLIQQKELEMISNVRDNLRQRKYLEKLRTGDIYEGVEVLRNLTTLSKQRKLSAGDQTMLNNAREMFISEVALVKGLNQEQAAHLVI